MRSPLSSFVLAAVLTAAALAAPRSHAQQPSAGPAAAPPPTQTTSAEVLVAVSKVQSFYDKTTSFRSDFTQKFWVKAYNQEKESKGHVTFAKPGKMDWVYDNPKDNRVVSDGAQLRVYEASNRQMFEQAVNKSQYPAA